MLYSLSVDVVDLGVQVLSKGVRLGKADYRIGLLDLDLVILARSGASVLDGTLRDAETSSQA